jgi:hypothetical protein
MSGFIFYTAQFGELTVRSAKMYTDARSAYAFYKTLEMVYPRLRVISDCTMDVNDSDVRVGEALTRVEFFRFADSSTVADLNTLQSYNALHDVSCISYGIEWSVDQVLAKDYGFYRAAMKGLRNRQADPARGYTPANWDDLLNCVEGFNVMKLEDYIRASLNSGYLNYCGDIADPHDKPDVAVDKWLRFVEFVCGCPFAEIPNRESFSGDTEIDELELVDLEPYPARYSPVLKPSRSISCFSTPNGEMYLDDVKDVKDVKPQIDELIVLEIPDSDDEDDSADKIKKEPSNDPVEPQPVYGFLLPPARKRKDYEGRDAEIPPPRPVSPTY